VVSGEIRFCSQCGNEFMALVPQFRECMECRLARGDHDDRDERAKARARTLTAALAKKRSQP
jgi:hypothetical protein